MQQVLEEKDKAVSRISGYLRYDTAIEISRRGWDSTDTVVLARGDDFADALTAVPLAFKLDAPILLTGTNKLYNETLREIKRLKASNVVIIGGTGAISEGIYTTLANEGLNVRRLYGSSRTETAAIIAEEVAPNGSEQAFVVNGYDFPDALSAAPYAANQGIPILVSQTNKLPVATIKALDSLNVQESMVIGGASVVTESVKSKLPQPTRISGKDRYETNILLAEHFNPNVESMYVATGTNFADSLAGATLAAKNNTGILLVHHRIPESVKNFITENGVQELTIFGGKAAVSEEIRKDLLKLLQ
ncbi:cell wall-binding repeat-containing protein [Oceanobacillus luteolus]|nr:cell wall-binding repeat-containing protein [Oceanobacillus luteolus]